MSSGQISFTWKHRRDTAANWTANATVLGDGQLGFETDTGLAKLGDGTTAWAGLSYLYGAAGSGLADADYGDVVVTGGGTVMTLDSGVVTTAAKTVLDDATVSAMVDTLGGASSTGTGGIVRATSPTLVTPALGTPSALVATNATGTATGLTSGITNALKSATTTVDVSAATAPTSGQVLTATAGTTATWQTPSGGGLSDGDKGDITVGGSGTTMTIDAGVVTLAKMADLAQDAFIVRTTASTGVPETATCTAAARTVLDDASVSAMVDTLGGASSTGTGGLVRATSPTLVTPALGTPSALVATNATGTATGLTAGAANGLISATTTVSVSAATAPSSGQVLTATNGTTATWATPPAPVDDSITYSMIQNVSATDKVLGRSSGGAGNVEEIDCTAAARSVLDDASVSAMVDTLGGASATGTGGLVRATSPTLVTPALGTPSALVGTNITGTAAGLTAGTVTTNANLTGPVTSVGNATTIADAELAAIAGLTSAADKLPYFTGSGTAALADFTATGRLAIAASSLSTFRDVMGIPRFFEDFAMTSAPSGWNNSLTGSGAVVNANGGADSWCRASDVVGYVGIHNGAGTATTDAVSYRSSGKFYLFDGACFVFRVGLDGATTNQKMRWGFRDSTAATLWNDWTNGCYFELDTSTSANIYACTAQGGARTKTDTGLANTAMNSTFLEFMIEFVSDTEVNFYYWTAGAWSLLHSETGANIPSTNTERYGNIHLVTAGNGSATRYLNVDYVALFGADALRSVA